MVRRVPSDEVDRENSRFRRFPPLAFGLLNPGHVAPVRRRAPLCRSTAEEPGMVSPDEIQSAPSPRRLQAPAKFAFDWNGHPVPSNLGFSHAWFRPRQAVEPKHRFQLIGEVQVRRGRSLIIRIHWLLACRWQQAEQKNKHRSPHRPSFVQLIVRFNRTQTATKLESVLGRKRTLEITTIWPIDPAVLLLVVGVSEGAAST